MLDTLQLNEFKRILMDQIDKLPKSIALCLSAGYDSISLFSLLLEAEKNITVYSFTLEDYESYDYRIAKYLANISNCNFCSVKLPINLIQLKQDILTLHREYACKKKTEYECTWPFIYVYPNIKEDVIVTGLGAEGHFGTTKRGSIHYKENLDEFRTAFFNNPNVSQINQHSKLCYQYGVDKWFPFLTSEVKEFFIGKSWFDVNTPKLKQPVFDLICDKFKDIRFKSSNLQLGSGISKHFDKLLVTNWNLHGYKSVVGIFNSINRGELPNDKRKLI